MTGKGCQEPTGVAGSRVGMIGRMSLIRRLARPLLAATFVVGGIDTLRNPAPRVPAADKIVGPLVDRVPALSSTEQVVMIDAGVKVLGGIMLASGRSPRLASIALASSLVPTTLAGHRFWEVSDPAARKQQRLHVLKNAGILGGLLLAAVDTEGRPSLAWRAKRAPGHVRHAAGDLRRHSEKAAHSVADTVRDTLPA
jgi:putative oxidoreductase